MDSGLGNGLGNHNGLGNLLTEGYSRVALGWCKDIACYLTGRSLKAWVWSSRFRHVRLEYSPTSAACNPYMNTPSYTIPQTLS